jgi:2-polyprenyl-3-methyl-5-hydroxy-6-metoxy-1,4-benzoquinol methylase
MSDLNKTLFEKYLSVHGYYVNAPAKIREAWFLNLVKYNYLPFLTQKESSILEIGCGNGLLLKALKFYGYNNLYGIDLSKEDINQIPPDLCESKYSSVFDYLPQEEFFGYILTKDVFEHIPYDELEKFVQIIESSLVQGGKALIQVPNMDWLLSNHERYMDLTHTVGFTRESLGQICRLYFKDVKIIPVIYDFPEHSLSSKLKFYLMRPLFVWMIRNMFRILGSGLQDCWFDSREILAICEK